MAWKAILEGFKQFWRKEGGNQPCWCGLKEEVKLKARKTGQNRGFVQFN